MIRYDLICACGHAFDAWFRNGAAFDDQKAAGVLLCPACGSAGVEKTLMAPALTKGQGSLSPDEREKAMRDMMQDMRRRMTESAEYVGEKFPEEARKIHYEEVEPKGVYGEASVDEIKSLYDEGIVVLPLPDGPDERN